jgi:cobyrinic acid a,c-diamide synthase
MLLGKQLIEQNGTVWPMAAVLAYSCKMQNTLASLGYREESNGMKGHEFHYSVRECNEDYQPCFDCNRGDPGIRYLNIRASYIHWYFASCPEVMAGWLSKPK